MNTPTRGYVDRLRGELQDVQAWIARLTGEPRPAELESGGDNTPFSEEIDAMQAAEEAEMRSQFLAWLTERETRLREALDRVAQGLYGLCVRCNRTIPRDRLLAVPEATLCVRCQSLAEIEGRQGRVGPNEWEEAARWAGERALTE
jgi:DnaK suppressor protein